MESTKSTPQPLTGPSTSPDSTPATPLQDRDIQHLSNMPPATQSAFSQDASCPQIQPFPPSPLSAPPPPRPGVQGARGEEKQTQPATTPAALVESSPPRATREQTPGLLQTPSLACTGRLKVCEQPQGGEEGALPSPSTSVRGPSGPPDDRRRATSEVRGGGRAYWLCSAPSCSHRNWTLPGSQCGRPGCPSRRARGQ